MESFSLVNLFDGRNLIVLSMTTRKHAEIRLMVEFLWRTLFGYSNYLQHKQNFNREFSQNLVSHLMLTGTSVLHTMTPAGETRQFSPGPELRAMTKVFINSYNQFLENEWHDIMTAGFPPPLQEVWQLIV